MIRALTASLVIATGCLAAENAATEAGTETKQEKKSGFSLSSLSEISGLATKVADKVDGKLTYLEQGVAALKPTIDALAQPANAKTAEYYTTLSASLPKIRTAVNALKTGKSADPKTDLKSIEDNLKTVESLYAQIQGMLPAKGTATSSAQATQTAQASKSVTSAASADKKQESATQPQAEQPKKEKKSGFKLPGSIAEVSALATTVADQVDGKLTYLEQGVATLKPTIDALAQPANAKTAEYYATLSASLPKVRSAVDALKTGKSANPKADLKSIEDNLKTAEALYAQIQGMLPAKKTNTPAASAK